MNCPSCGASVLAGALECPACGVILAKAKPRTETRIRRPEPAPAPGPARGIPRLLVGVIAAVILLGAGFSLIRSRSGSAESTRTLKQTTSRHTGFDLAYALPGSPGGAATDGTEIVIGNRSDPWGFLRLRRSGDTYTAEQVPLIEPRYQQKMSVSTLTWNGESYIGYTTASWFQAKGDAFTIHNAKSLGIDGWKAAPKLLGCLAWDGQSYWAATRRNTADSPEPALLYKLDKGFNVVSTSEAPAVGCQGLAWDGRHLWMADVFSDSIYVIDPAGEQPQLVYKAPTDLSYLSGVVVFNGHVWVTDYDDNLLQRIAPATRVAWAGGEAAPAGSVAAASAMPASGDDIATLERQLRSEQWTERMHAEMELGRRGAPIAFDRDENRFVDREPDDTEMIDWSVELRDDAVFGSWKIWFGPDLFVRGQQTSTIITLPEFARYRVTVRQPDGTEVEREFDATAGDNVTSDIRLADATAAGEYNVSVFLHVQYVKPDGQGQILNRSGTSLHLKR